MPSLAAIFRRSLDLADRLSLRLEERPVPPGRYLALFAAVILARHLLEILVGQNPFFSPLQFWIHYPLAYLAPMLALVLVLHFFSGVPVVRVTRLMLYLWALTLLPPIVDLLTGRSAETIGYLAGEATSPGEVFLRFFDPRASFEGTTAGIRVETAVACLLGAGYVWLRRRREPRVRGLPLRMAGAAAGVYLCALSFFTLPLGVEAAASPFVAPPSSASLYLPPAFVHAGGPVEVMDRVRILCLVPLCLGLGAAWLAASGRGALRKIVSGLDPLAPARAVILVCAGIALGSGVAAALGGRMPEPRPLDLLTAAGLVLASALCAWAANLLAGRGQPEAGRDRRLAGAVLATASLVLGLASDGVTAMLLATALALACLPEGLRLAGIARATLAAPTAGLAGLAFVGAGLSWAVQDDALVLIPPVLVLGVFLGAAGAEAAGVPVSAGQALGKRGMPIALAATGSIVAALAVPLIAGSALPAALACALLAAVAVALAFGDRVRLRRGVVALALAVGLWGSLAPGTVRARLVDSVLERPKWLARRAMALESEGRWAEAVAAYRSVLEREPGWAKVQARLGELLWSKQGDLAGAEAALRSAAELDPTAVAARQQLGIVLARQGRVREAVPWLEQAVELAPHQPVVIRAWAEVLSALPERRAQAERAWRRYLEASRGWPDEEAHREEARRRLRSLESGDAPPGR